MNIRHGPGMPTDLVMVKGAYARAHAEAICGLLAGRDRRRRIAAAGRTRVDQSFSLQAFQDRLGRLYDDAPGSDA